MTFLQAKKQLDKLAKGKYRSLRYQATINEHNKVIEVECRLYVDPGIGVSGQTWNEAFTKLTERLNPAAIDHSLEEAPTREEVASDVHPNL